MEHQLGRIDIVAWQGRRLRDQHRAPLASLAAVAAFGFAALVLLLHFGAGAAAPLLVLQAAFAVLVGSGALLLTRLLAGLVLRLQQR